MKPCFFEIDGKRLNYDQMRELLLDRPDLVEIGMKQTEAPKPRTKKPTAPKTYGEVLAHLQEEIGLTDEEVGDYLPTYLQQQAGLTPKTKNIKSAYNILMTQDPADLIVDENTGEGDMSKKIANWVRKEQSEKGWIDKQLDAVDGIIDDLKSSATSGPAIYFYQAYKAVLQAAKAAGEAITASTARKRAMDMVVSAGQATKEELDKMLRLIEKTPTIRKHKPILKALEAALTEGVQTASKLLKTGLKDLKADLTPKQINALLDKLGRIKKLTPRAIERFMEDAEKIVGNANYILQERAATTLRNRVGKMAESASQTALNRALYKAFSGLSIREMEAPELQKFIDFATKIVGNSTTKDDRAAIEEFITEQRETESRVAQARAEKSAKRLEKNQKEEYERLKKEGQLPDGVTDFESYLENLSNEPGTEKQVAEVKQLLDSVEIPENASASDVAIIKGLRAQDLSVLSTGELSLLENGLSTFEDTGRIFGLGDLLSKAKAWNSVNDLIAQGIKTRKLVDYKDAVRNSVTLIFNRFFNSRLDAAKVRGAIVQPWLSASTNAYVKFENARSRILLKAKTLGLKESNWDRMDLFGFLNESDGNPELFKRLKAQKLSDLETMKEFLDSQENKNDSNLKKIVAEQYRALSQAATELSLESAESVQDIEKKLTDSEKEFYSKTLRPELDAISPKLIQSIEQYGNRLVDVVKNYWPRNAKKKVEKVAPINELQGLSFYEPNKVGKNIFGREKGRVALVGKNGWYEPKGQLNFFNGLREAILISEAAPMYWAGSTVGES